MNMGHVPRVPFKRQVAIQAYLLMVEIDCVAEKMVLVIPARLYQPDVLLNKFERTISHGQSRVRKLVMLFASLLPKRSDLLVPFAMYD